MALRSTCPGPQLWRASGDAQGRLDQVEQIARQERPRLIIPGACHGARMAAQARQLLLNCALGH
ncbi:hypothetical protein [Pseudomonas sp. Irchel 3H9]|uniref:hypothetical protein n=1 Tax=Pseudomonas sp. Irchel 3H9 TaxID=2009043 RepID=UPI002113DD5B|nr:hypothetical protein [Pseudomonas sp. Irchel 3H9]